VFVSLDDVLVAVQAAIRDDLWPETSSTWADRQAQSALWALEHVRARLARGREILLAEHEQLTGLLAVVEEARAGESGALLRGVETPVLSGRIAAELLDPELEREVTALTASAEQLAALLPDLEGPVLGALQKQLKQYLVDHDRRIDSVVVLDYTC
jgi:hypothetical protein